MRRLVLALAVMSAGLLASARGLAAQTPSPVAEYRQGLMSALAAHTGGIRAILGGEVTEPDHVLLHARAVGHLGEMLQGVWPEGSGGEGTRALPEIWTEGDDFQERLEALRGATARLRQVAEAGDREGIGAAMQELGQICRGCHTTYRSRSN
jgi:cytochrome c556